MSDFSDDDVIDNDDVIHNDDGQQGLPGAR